MIYNLVNMKQLAIIILVISNIILLYPVKLNWGIDLVWETFFSMDFWYGRCLTYFSLVLMSFILMLKYKDTPKLFFFSNSRNIYHMHIVNLLDRESASFYSIPNLNVVYIR